MTENRAQKQAIRQRQAETGEKYTQARRVIVAVEEAILGLLAERPRTGDELAEAIGGTFRPDDVSAVLRALVRARRVLNPEEGLYQLRPGERPGD